MKMKTNMTEVNKLSGLSQVLTQNLRALNRYVWNNVEKQIQMSLFLAKIMTFNTIKASFNTCNQTIFKTVYVRINYNDGYCYFTLK